jgi:nucleotide-binding universal stress UspA family protein
MDGSELSLAALEPAQKMAAATAAEVHLLRVLDVSGVHEKTRGKMAANRRVTSDWSGGSLPGAGGGFQSRKRRETRMMVEDRGQAVVRLEDEAGDAIRDIATTFPADVTCKVVEGRNAAAAITGYAREIEPDFIVMATHSRKGLGRMLFGSTTSDVVASGVAPVLVVHPTVG